METVTEQAAGAADPAMAPASAPAPAQPAASAGGCPAEAAASKVTSDGAAPAPAAASQEDQVVPAILSGAETEASAQQLEVLGMLLGGPCSDSSIAPAPERLQLPLPKEGFMCDQCGDRFVLPSSLAQHQARRSLRATFDCPPCATTMVFTNKCQLLEHLDLHQIDPVSVNPALIDAFALTPADLGCPAPRRRAADQDANADPKRQKTQINKVNRPVRVSCPMCNILCSTHTLPDHFTPPTEPGVLITKLLTCPECEQTCATQCSLMAHISLHKDLFPYPYVCPECGLKILGSHEEAEKHVQGSCLHSARMLKVCCVLCKSRVLPDSDVHEHVLQSHVQKLYKCRRCPLAFESTNGFDGHLADKHPDQVKDPDQPLYMLILKCPFCAATFNNAAALKAHMVSPRHSDQVLQTQSFVFACHVCDQDFETKGQLWTHLRESHPEFDPSTVCIVQMVEVKPPSPMPAPQVRYGRPPKHLHAARGGDAAHLYAEGSQALSPSQRGSHWTCAVCKGEFRRKTDFTDHARIHLREGYALCMLCNTRFSSSQALKNHLSDHASEGGKDRCSLCYAKFAGRESLQYHLEGEHNLRDYTCVRCDKSFENLTELNHHNNTIHTSRANASGRGGARVPPRAKAVPLTPGSAAALKLETKQEMLESVDDPHSLVPAPKAAARRGRPIAITDPYQLPEPVLGDTELSPPPMPDGTVFTCFECDFSSTHRDALAWHVQTEHVEDSETLEDIASFVAAGGEPGEEDEPEEVIELEMKAGEITRKQTDGGDAMEYDDDAGDLSAEYITPDLDGFGMPTHGVM